MASLILGNIGSALLGPVGGFIGSAIGSYIDNLLFAPKPDDVHGPRLEDLAGVSADPGVPIPIVYGADRIPGIVAHTTDLIETVHKEEVGGKGGPTQDVYSYTYHVDIDYMLCEGPILGIARIWADGRLIRGTAYQMELDTEENFEKIGGIPYEDWYWDDYYVPAETPWSYDPTYTPTIENQKYIWNVVDGFTPITDEEAAAFLTDTIVVVYAYDTGSEKYLPIPASHDYTGERLEAGGTIEVISSTTTLPGISETQGSAGDSYSGRVNVGTATEPTDPNIPEGATILSRTVKMTVEGSIEMNESDDIIFGQDNGFLSSISAGVGFGGALDSAVMTVYTPASDSPENRPPPGPAADTLELEATALPTDSFIEYEINLTRGLAAFDYTASMTATLTQTTTVTNVPPSIRDWPDYYNFYDAINDFSPKSVLQFFGPEGVAVYRGTDDQISDPTMELVAPDQDCGVPAYIGRAHVVFQRFELADFGNRIPNLTFEVVQDDNTRIRNVITDLMTRADIDTSLYDIDGLPENDVPSFILGYSIGTVTSFRAAMEPLLDAFEVDSAEIGDKIIFRDKRRVPDHTIDYNDLAPKESGSSPEPPLRFAFRDPVEMPVALDIRYKDPEREYQPSTSRFTRQNAPGTQSSVIELPMVRQPHIMKEFTRDKMRDLWLERISVSFSLPQKYTFISPSDLVTITNSPDGKFDYTFKIIQVTRRDDGNLEFEGVRREPTLYVPVAGELENNGTRVAYVHAQNVNSLLPATKHFQVNLPALRTEDNLAGYYFGLSGQEARWAGGTLYRFEGTSWEEIIATPASGRGGAVEDYSIGFNKSNQLYEIDFESTVTIRLFNKDEQLASVNDEQFLRLENIAVIGQEIIGFKNATSLGDGVYRLDTLLRARLDTEDHASQHTTGEVFLLLDPNELESISVDLSEVGATEIYNSVTFGGGLPDPLNNTEFTVTYERLKPFRPIHLQMRVGALVDNGGVLFNTYPVELVNGDAETGDTTGWGLSNTGPPIATDGTTGSVSSPNSGTYFFEGGDTGGTDTDSWMSQTIALLSADAELADTNQLFVNVDWYQFADTGGTDDKAKVRIEFLNSNEDVIGECESPLADPESWTQRQFYAKAPSNTRAYRLFFDFITDFGGYNDAAIDDILVSVGTTSVGTEMTVTLVDPELNSETMIFSWIRQNRFYFSIQDGVDIPNSEAFQRYEVEIRISENMAIDPIRTLTVEDTTQAGYTENQRTDDGLSSGDTIYVTVYQISDVAGRGNPVTGEFVCP